MVREFEISEGGGVLKTMLKGKDQTFARDYNMKAILQLLAIDEMSCSELADRIGLSKPAMTKITAEMHKLNLITQGSKNDGANAALGRKRVYLSINPNYGMVAAIDFSTVTIKIRLCDMNGKIIEQRLLPDSEYITPQILENTSNQLKEMLSSYISNGKELLALCVAASGMVDKLSEEVVVSPKFKACAGINLNQYFSEIFSCRVDIKNDVNLALVGEQRFGKMGSFSDAVMFYIDSGLGGALILDNKIVAGTRGFAGEFGLIEVTTDKGSVALDLLCSINAMKNAIREKGKPECLPERFRFADLVKAYHEGEPTVVSVVEYGITTLAGVIRNMCIALDVHNVIISGRVRLLGLSYLQKLRSNVPNCVIEFNRLESDGIIVGAIHEALTMAIDVVIERR